jgi:hypothetical protein
VPYKVCSQPGLLLRLDLHALGINWRRIPIVTIRKDAFLDNAAILDVLQQLFPDTVLQTNKTDKGFDDFGYVGDEHFDCIKT